MKILAIASAGGHWIQLLRLQPAFLDGEVIYISTKPEFAKMVEGKSFYIVPDGNRNNKLGLIKAIIKIFKIVMKLKPNVIITTGAAPGILALIAGKLIGSKTIWIDSIANVEELSLSGKFAVRIANRVYTQWPDLANDKIIYAGNVLT